jgi:fermentation-respiration switch protein FrsA (DUF1100 family)
MPTRGKRIRRFLLRWAALLFGLWVVVLLVMLALENSLVYHPRSAAENWVAPVNPRTQDVWLTSADGTKLHAWWLPHEAAKGVVLVAHGNGGNVSHRGPLAADLHDTLGHSVLLVEYPGYGKSEGKPSEAGCYAAGEAAFKWLTDDRKVPANQIVLMGESLGGGVAVELATRHDHRALALLHTFTSLPAAAKFHYPWLPTRMLMTNRFDNLSKIAACKRPVFVAHGTADAIVPYRQGEELYQAANEPKRLLALRGHDHNDPLPAAFVTGLRDFLAEVK